MDNITQRLNERLSERPDPSEAQKSAGNYKKGMVFINGMRVSIENPAGSTRKGKDQDGNEWESELKHHYGYIRGTQGRDKDHVDAFLASGGSVGGSDRVHIIDQVDPKTGRFDEHKVILGAKDKDHAADTYLANYPEDWDGFGAVTEMPLKAFKQWAFQPGRRVKALSSEVHDNHMKAKSLPKFAEGGSVLGALKDNQFWRDVMGNAGDMAQSASNAVAGNIAGPVDIINWGLKKAGIGSEKPVLGSDWLKDKGLMRDVPHGLPSVVGETLGLLAPMGMIDGAPRVARALNKGAENLAAPRTLNPQAGVFVGHLSKTWDREAAKLAEEMALAGANPRDIWSKTGTWKSPDGRWRQELPDNTARLLSPEEMAAKAGGYKARQIEIKDQIKASKEHPDLFPKELTSAQKQLRAEAAAYKTPLTEYYGMHGNGERGSKAKYALEHDSLYSAYPDIGEEVVIRQGGNDGNFIGSYMSNQLAVNKAANSTSGGPTSTALHEIQHAIQEREGFGGGGNASDMTMRLFRDAIDDLESRGMSRMDAAAKLNQEAAKYNAQGMENYRRLAGEVEARAVQARANLTPQQRISTYPADSYDVPIDSLINHNGQPVQKFATGGSVPSGPAYGDKDNGYFNADGSQYKPVTTRAATDADKSAWTLNAADVDKLLTDDAMGGGRSWTYQDGQPHADLTLSGGKKWNPSGAASGIRFHKKGDPIYDQSQQPSADAGGPVSSGQYEQDTYDISGDLSAMTGKPGSNLHTNIQYQKIGDKLVPINTPDYWDWAVNNRATIGEFIQALSMMAPAVGGIMTNAGVGALTSGQSAALQAGKGALMNPTDPLKGAATGALGSYMPSIGGEFLSGMPDAVKGAITGGLSSALTGGNPLVGAVGGATGAAIKDATGSNFLSSVGKSIAAGMASGKTPDQVITGLLQNPTGLIKSLSNGQTKSTSPA